MKKKIIISVAFLLLMVILIALLTPLLKLKSSEDGLTGEYYEQAGGNDVIFLGDCEVYETFVPAKLWEEYGITSYVRGSPQQLIWQSYYILEETFEYETPKAVVFNVYAMKYGTPQNEKNNRMTLDSMRWSKSKISAIYASMTENESFVDYLVPFFANHNRITELTETDFKYWFAEKERSSDSGYLMNVGVKPLKAGYPVEPAEGLEFSQTAFDYLDKMKALCDEKGVELILVKAPTNSWKYYWFDGYEEQILDYAEKNGLKYYNLIEHEEEIGIDWNIHTHDEGAHLNVYGAEKTTVYFGKILSEECQIPNRRSDSEMVKKWSENLSAYNDRKTKLEEEKK